jgi:hypothetical protein
MPLQYFFWGFYVAALFLVVWSHYEAGQPLWYRRAGSHFILWVLVGMLGWRIFGSVVK